MVKAATRFYHGDMPVHLRDTPTRKCCQVSCVNWLALKIAKLYIARSNK